MFKQAEQIQQSAPASKSMQKSEALEVQLSCKQCGKKYKFYVKLKGYKEKDWHRINILEMRGLRRSKNKKKYYLNF